MSWQLGLLSGFVFAIFYSVLGLPIAHLSERVGRKLALITGIGGAVGKGQRTVENRVR